MMKEKDMITLLVLCRFCGAAHEIEVDVDDYFNWTIGLHAQEAFPYLLPWQREMFISHTCPTCWDKMSAGHEDEFWEDDEDVVITLNKMEEE